MAETFRCPSCSAPLAFEGRPVQKCRFCGSSVIVPAHVAEAARGGGGGEAGGAAAAGGRSAALAEVRELLGAGSKIAAIKVFRETFGCGLKEAKDAVEALERGEGFDPEKLRAAAAASAAAPAENVGRAGGGALLGRLVVTLVVTGAVIALAFFLISRSLERPAANAPASAPAAPAPAPTATPVPSIAAELLKFGGEGLGAGKFQDNRAIAVDADGRIYSADARGGRVQIFDANGAFLAQIMTDTSRGVDALAADRKGSLFVLQGYDVLRVDRETGAETGRYRVDTAADLALGLDGRLYVAARRGGVTVLGADGARIKKIEPPKELGLDSIEKIALDGAGNLFLVDGRSGAVFKLAPDGRFLTRFGGRASGPADKMPKGQFAGYVHGLAVDSRGRLYASQISRVSVFDADGNYLDDFKTTQAFGLAFDENDALYVAARPFVVKYKVSL